MLGVGEHAVHGIEHRRDRAERGFQRYVLERLFSVGEFLCKARAHFVEHIRRSALKRKDRLFLVADSKECARLAAASGSGEEFAGEMFENAPLRWARILRFVNKDMVDTRIELVEHPARI